jgi:hypothetical protein
LQIKWQEWAIIRGKQIYNKTTGQVPCFYRGKMGTYFPDTHPKAEAVQIALIRQAPTWRRAYLMGSLNHAVRTAAYQGLKARYPHEPDQLLRRRLADILLGKELALKVYGPLSQGS